MSRKRKLDDSAPDDNPNPSKKQKLIVVKQESNNESIGSSNSMNDNQNNNVNIDTQSIGSSNNNNNNLHQSSLCQSNPMNPNNLLSFIIQNSHNPIQRLIGNNNNNNNHGPFLDTLDNQLLLSSIANCFNPIQGIFGNNNNNINPILTNNNHQTLNQLSLLNQLSSLLSQQNCFNPIQGIFGHNNNNNNNNNPQILTDPSIQVALNLVSALQDPSNVSNNNNNNNNQHRIQSEFHQNIQHQHAINNNLNHCSTQKKIISHLFGFVAFHQIPIIPNKKTNHNKDINQQYAKDFCELYDIKMDQKQMSKHVGLLHEGFVSIEKAVNSTLDHQIQNEINNFLIHNNWQQFNGSIIDTSWLISMLKSYKIGFLNKIIPDILRAYEQTEHERLTMSKISLGIIIFLSYQVSVSYLKANDNNISSFNGLLKDILSLFFSHFRVCSHSIKQTFLDKLNNQGHNNEAWPSLEFILEFIKTKLFISIEFDESKKEYKNRDHIVEKLIHNHLFIFASKILNDSILFKQILEIENNHSSPIFPPIHNIKSENGNNNDNHIGNNNNDNHIGNKKYQYSIINQEITMKSGLDLNTFMKDGNPFQVSDIEPQCYVNVDIPIQPESCPDHFIVSFNSHQSSERGNEKEVHFYRMSNVSTNVKFSSIFKRIRSFYTVKPNDKSANSLYSQGLDVKNMYIYYNSNGGESQKIPMHSKICDVLYGQNPDITKFKLTQSFKDHHEKCLFIDVSYEKRIDNNNNNKSKKNKKKKKIKTENDNQNSKKSNDCSFIDLTNDD